MIFALLAALALTPTALAHEDIEHALLEAAEASALPADLVMVYDDMHDFHGGTTIIVRGDGRAVRLDRATGGAAEIRTEVTLTRRQVQRLFELTVAISAWEQQVPERPMVAGESRARAVVRAGGQEGGFWEFYNDMDQLQRLSRVRDEMALLVP